MKNKAARVKNLQNSLEAFNKTLRPDYEKFLQGTVGRSYLFSNDQRMGEIVPVMRQFKMPRLPDSSLRVAVLVGESNFISLLPELERHVDLVVLVDIDPLVLGNCEFMLDALLKLELNEGDNPLEAYLQSYLLPSNPVLEAKVPANAITVISDEGRSTSGKESTFIGADVLRLLLGTKSNSASFGDPYFLHNETRFRACQQAAKNLKVATLNLDLFDTALNKKLVEILCANEAHVTVFNATNLFFHDAEKEIRTTEGLWEDAGRLASNMVSLMVTVSEPLIIYAVYDGASTLPSCRVTDNVGFMLQDCRELVTIENCSKIDVKYSKKPCADLNLLFRTVAAQGSLAELKILVASQKKIEKDFATMKRPFDFTASVVININGVGNGTGQSALHRAVLANQEEKVDFLLTPDLLAKQKIEVNLLDKKDCSPLYFAWEKRNLIVFGLLLEQGSDPDQPTFQKQSVVDHIRKSRETGAAEKFMMAITLHKQRKNAIRDSVPLYKVEPLRTEGILTAKKPLSQNPVVVLTPKDQFNEDVAKARGIKKFEMSENIHVPGCVREQIASHYAIADDGLGDNSAVFNKLVVCDSADSRVGKLLCTQRSFRKGEFVLIYSGEVFFQHKDIPDPKSDDYEFQISSGEWLQVPLNCDLAITPKYIGGFASFMQDLVDPVDSFVASTGGRCANSLMIKVRVYDFDLLLTVCMTDIQEKQQLGFCYGKQFWLTLPDNRRMQKQYFDQNDNLISGLLLEERANKIRYIKTLLPSDTTPKMIALMIMLAISPKEILDALNNSERKSLSLLRRFCRENMAAIAKQAISPGSVAEYSGYDKQWITTENFQLGLKSKLSALNVLINNDVNQIPDNTPLATKLVNEAKKLYLSANEKYHDKKFDAAIREWVAVIEIYQKTQAHCGVIYFHGQAIPLSPLLGRLYWNIGNAFRQKGDHVSAHEYLSFALNMQSYFTEPMLENKTIKDIELRVQENFNELNISTARKIGLSPQKATVDDSIFKPTL